jgi:hypothetical protein
MSTTRPPRQPDPERQAEEVASSFVDRLSRKDRRDFLWAEERVAYPLLSDVESTIEELDTSLLWAEREGGRFPCILDEEQVAVPIVSAPTDAQRFPSRNAFYSPQFDPFYHRQYVEEALEQLSVLGKIVWWDPRIVPKMILGPLTKFLTVRFGWMAENPEFRSLGAAASGPSNNPYLPFMVHTRTSGLRIHYSKAFALNFNPVLGAPTTPVSGWILPGIHKFAGMDAKGRMHYDRGTFSTPPDFSAQLMI